MLTPNDIKRIIEAEKEVFPTKDDFEDLRQDFSSLKTAVDNYSKSTSDLKSEVSILNHRVTELE